jgi:hypothetical protein
VWEPVAALDEDAAGSGPPAHGSGTAQSRRSFLAGTGVLATFDYVSHHLDHEPDIFPEGHSNPGLAVAYDDLEPYFTRFEYDTGMSGRTGNPCRAHPRGWQPFEGPRSRPYRSPPRHSDGARHGRYEIRTRCCVLGAEVDATGLATGGPLPRSGRPGWLTVACPVVLVAVLFDVWRVAAIGLVGVVGTIAGWLWPVAPPDPRAAAGDGR